MVGKRIRDWLQGLRGRDEGEGTQAARREALEAAWSDVARWLPIIDGLRGEDRERLLVMAVEFLGEHDFHGVALDADPEPEQQAAIALQAALPVLKLGLDWYEPWHTVVVYPAGFVAVHEHEDEAGVVHREEGPLIGEAWERGPMILSLEDALDPDPGTCVVIHECAHKLDMRSGAVNGLPPLPTGMEQSTWSRVFSEAYERLLRSDLSSEAALIDPYAAEEPGEFFAVVVEIFFADPDRLLHAFPDVYGQLRRLFGLDPRGLLRRDASPEPFGPGEAAAGHWP